MGGGAGVVGDTNSYIEKTRYVRILYLSDRDLVDIENAEQPIISYRILDTC